jgi:hypothetical protein
MTRNDVSLLALDYLAKDGNGAGGNLHLVLEDGNVESSHIEYCLKQAETNGDNEGVGLAKAILQLSMTQRKKLYQSNWMVQTGA